MQGQGQLEDAVQHGIEESQEAKGVESWTATVRVRWYVDAKIAWAAAVESRDAYGASDFGIVSGS